jgi:hypothetical protein
MEDERVLRRASEHKFATLGHGENCMKIFTAFALHQISYCSNQGGLQGNIYHFRDDVKSIQKCIRKI